MFRRRICFRGSIRSICDFKLWVNRFLQRNTDDTYKELFIQSVWSFCFLQIKYKNFFTNRPTHQEPLHVRVTKHELPTGGSVENQSYFVKYFFFFFFFRLGQKNDKIDNC